MSVGKIISILLLVAGIIVTSIGGYWLWQELSTYDPNDIFTLESYITRPIIYLIIGIACLGTSIYISRKDKNKN